MELLIKISAAAALVTVAAVLVLGISRIVRDLRVERQARRAVARIAETVTPSDLGRILDDIRSDRRVREVIGTLRRSGVLRDSPAAVRFLSDLAAAAEATRSSKERKKITIASASGPDLERWLRGNEPAAAQNKKARHRLVRALSESTLDEIARAVAQVDS